MQTGGDDEGHVVAFEAVLREEIEQRPEHGSVWHEPGDVGDHDGGAPAAAAPRLQARRVDARERGAHGADGVGERERALRLEHRRLPWHREGEAGRAVA